MRGNVGGDWSAFTGTISVVSTDTGTDNFRISSLAGYPAAAVSLGANVAAQFFGNQTATVPLGELSGVAGSSLSGLNNSSSSVGAYTLMWEVGARGTDATYAGTIANGASPSITALRKVGAGTWTLGGACTHTGATAVVAGTLKITGSLSGTASLAVSAGATLELSAGTLAFTGPITNAGTVRLTGSLVLSSTGSFTNNGVLDLINGPQTLPAKLVNNGVVLDSQSVRAQVVTVAAGIVSVTILSHPGHSYQLQKKTALSSATWVNVSPAQPGATGTVLTFTDTPGTAAGFYRVVVVAP